MISADYLICGSGILGLTIARALVKQGAENIVIIEKEARLGEHASGRNSGVLHAGIYYSPDTLRAKSCLRGNHLMKDYCREKNLPLRESGKVIVAAGESELGALKELYQRALTNGARVELIDEQQLCKIEPQAKTHRMALRSHDTAVVDPTAILTALGDDLSASGKASILYNTEFKGIEGNTTALTSHGKIQYKTFINTSGAYSDRVAHLFGVGLNLKILPFKGLYKKMHPKKSSFIRGNIYPVPDMRTPFLGVHFTKTVSGDIYLGPTAMPAFGREHYGMLKGLDSESLSILLRDAGLLLVNRTFRETAFKEMKKHCSAIFFREASALVKGLNPEDILPADKVGIRPQIIDWEKKQLVMDFLIVKDNNSVHLLNTISPGFTSSMDFSGYIVRNYLQ